MICKGFAIGGDCFIFMYFQNPSDYGLFLCPCLEHLSAILTMIVSLLLPFLYSCPSLTQLTPFTSFWSSLRCPVMLIVLIIHYVYNPLTSLFVVLSKVFRAVIVLPTASLSLDTSLMLPFIRCLSDETLCLSRFP